LEKLFFPSLKSEWNDIKFESKVKTKTTNILCLCWSIVCVVESKKKTRKEHERNEEKI
jgi:hypothetical protein